MMNYVRLFASGVGGSIAIALLGVAPALAEAHPPPSDPSAATTGATCQADDEAAVAELDTRYQKAVKDNDAETIDRLLPNDFVLVAGHGTVFKKADFIADARNQTAIYEHQEDSNRTVRVFGDTAVVTALLRAKGTSGGSAFDYKLWFSDVYVRTPHGWRYKFAQASTILPPSP
jgi:ketosteroid isomerase-like protein